MTVSPLPLPTRSEWTFRESSSRDWASTYPERPRVVAAIVVLCALILQVSLSLLTALNGQSVTRVRSHSAPVTAAPVPGKPHC